MSKDRLSVALRESRYAGMLLVVIYGGALVLVWVADIPLWSRSLLSLGLAVSGLYSIVAHALRCVDTCPNMLYCDANDNWQIRNRSGQTQPAVLLPGAYVHPLITVLRFRRADGVLVPVVMLPDALDSDAFRRLRARVRTPS